MNRNRQSIIQIILVFIVISSFAVDTAFAIKDSENQEFSMPAKELAGWVIESGDSYWTGEELNLVDQVLSNSISALDDAGYDGQNLLSGYRFRRQHNEFVDGIDGRIAVVRHNYQEIVLSDSAFKRLQGYYIYHELGHVVDKRLGREPTRRFHEIAGSGKNSGQEETADGFWLNDHAHKDFSEATADAFALWVEMRYTNNSKPVFAHTPVTTDYQEIVRSFDLAIQQ